MPMYEYKCSICRISFTSTARNEAIPCPMCSRDARRRFSFSVLPSFQDGYTPTTGGYVANERDLRDQLKRKSEEATLRNGIEHRYVPVDLRDKAACGVSDEVYEARNENIIKQAEAARKPPPDISVEVRSK